MLYSILSSKTVDRNEYTRLIPSFKVTLRNVKGLRRSKVTGAPDGGTVGSRELRELRRLRVEAVPRPVSRVPCWRGDKPRPWLCNGNTDKDGGHSAERALQGTDRIGVRWETTHRVNEALKD